MLGLGGCSGGTSLNPVDWWHNLEGGPIAAARPPPPNTDAPYPSLGTVPDRPPGNDAAARGRIADALVADRANAQYDASIAPLAPARPLPPAPASSSENTSSGTFAAASAPPAPPPTAPRPAPRTAVQAAPLPAPAAAPVAVTSSTVAPPPEMPQAPPPPAALPGVAQTTAPTPPPPTPSPVSRPAPSPAFGAAVPISFVSGLAVLPTTAYAPLSALVQQRGAGRVAVVGFGAAADSSPAAQQAALPLALARARAIAAYLETAGVPAAVIRIDAEADGQGGVARLIH